MIEKPPSVDEVKRLALEMVAAYHLSTVYGSSPFEKARIAFECALEKLAEHAIVQREQPVLTKSSLKVEPLDVPNFLKFD